MSIRRTYLYYFIFLSFIIASFATVSYGFVLKKDWDEYLFFTTIFSIPVLLFVLGLSIMFGGITGWVVGGLVKKKLETMNSSLIELENGNVQDIENDHEDIEEIATLWTRFKHLQQRLAHQAEASQKLANERAAWHDQVKQEVVSAERNRLARELHDSVSQQLFAASMLLSAVNEQQKNHEEPLQKQLKLVEEIVNESQSEMRALLLHLRPVQLEGKSLKVGIEELLNELIAKQPMKIIWNVDEIKLEKGIEDHLFRIIQEVISNTLRHAKAKTVELRLMNTQKFVLLKIVDDGVGFDMTKQKAGSYGLVSIQERVSEIGGTIKIISIPNKGTSIEVKVPIIEKKDGEDDKSIISG